MTQPSLPHEQRTMTTADPLGAKIEAIPGMEVCDFCTGTPTIVRYPCGLVVFETPLGTHTSSDPWGACAECAALIEANDREPLVIRALQAFVAEHGAQPVDVMRDIAAMLTAVQGRFFAARLGDAQPL